MKNVQNFNASSTGENTNGLLIQASSYWILATSQERDNCCWYHICYVSSSKLAIVQRINFELWEIFGSVLLIIIPPPVVTIHCLGSWFSWLEIYWIFLISCQDFGNYSWQNTQYFERLKKNNSLHNQKVVSVKTECPR